MGKVRRRVASLILRRGLDLATEGTRMTEKKSARQTWEMLTAGYLRKKNWFAPGRTIAQKRPKTHARNVDAGIVGSSVLATADRTSG